jgi:hypothetical protein
MTKIEYRKMSSADFKKTFGCTKKYYYNLAKDRLSREIEEMKVARPIGVVLHHINFDDPNYEKWENVIPMYRDEHARIHHTGKPSGMKGKKQSENYIRQIKERMTGLKLPEYWRRAQSEGRKGMKFSEEHCRNIGLVRKGTKCYNDGHKNKYCFSSPGDGWTLGRLKKEAR